MAAYITARTFAADTTAATTTPAIGDFVALGRTSRYVEFSFARGATHPSAPTSTDLWFWTAVGSSIRLVKQLTFTAANVDAQLPFVLDASAEKVYVTLASFTGGATPSLTMTVTARAVP